MQRFDVFFQPEESFITTINHKVEFSFEVKQRWKCYTHLQRRRFGYWHETPLLALETLRLKIQELGIEPKLVLGVKR